MPRVTDEAKPFPLSVLQEAIKAVPAVKYALGVAGIAAAVALVAAMVDLRAAAVGTVVMFSMMVVLVLFARLTKIAGPALKLPVMVLTWSMLVLTLAVAGFLVTSIFFQWPLDLKGWLVPGGVSADGQTSKVRADPPVARVNPSDPRLHIAMLPFETSDTAARVAFEQFRAVLSEKIFTLSQEFNARGAAFDYVTRLRLSNEGPALASFAELRDYWKEKHALQLVRGQVESGGSPATVQSVIFLGELAPAAEHTGVRLRMQVTPSEFGSTRDSYSVVILYALARDAKRLGKPRDVVSAFLSRAYSIGQDLNGSVPDVIPITDSVSTMLREVTGTEP